MQVVCGGDKMQVGGKNLPTRCPLGGGDKMQVVSIRWRDKMQVVCGGGGKNLPTRCPLGGGDKMQVVCGGQGERISLPGVH